MRECPTCSELFDDEVGYCPHDGATLKKPDPWLGRELDAGVTLKRVAGRGAMGTVYEAWQAGMERTVAVKILHGDLSRAPEYLERFHREARAIARLNHPNIVSVYLLGDIDGRPYIIMEYVDGETVLDVIKRHGPMAPDRVARIMRQVVSALADAHATNVIHRDLKPSNILLSQRRRAADFVKMLDFGVAKITDATDSNLTQEGFVFGTPAYLSPEQANGVALDHRCDLYSLGVSMFEMLTGDLPFKGGQVKLLLSHARETAPLAHEVHPGVPLELSQLVAALLEKRPEDRPQSAEDVADILDHMADNPAGISPWASAMFFAPDEENLMETRRRVRPPPVPDTPDPVWADRREAPWLSRQMQTMKQRVGGPGGWLLVVVLLIAGVIAGVLAGLGPLRGWLPVWDIAVPGPPPIETPVADAGAPVTDGRREAVMLGQDGYSLRVLRPAETAAGGTYEISIDVWDPDGEPFSADQIPVEIAGPKRDLLLAARPGKSRGRYDVVVTFSDPGDHKMKIFPPTGDNPVVLHFDVAARSGD